MSTIGERFKQLRQFYQMNQTTFSKAIHVSQGTLSDIEKGKFTPSVETVLSVSGYFRISTDWLLQGIGPGPGELPSGKEKATTIAEPGSRYNTPPTDPIYTLVDRWNQLPPTERQKIHTILLAAIELAWSSDKTFAQTNEPPGQKQETNLKKVRDAEEVYLLPVISRLAIGTLMATGDYIEGYVPSTPELARQKAFLARAGGDSMIMADIHDGDLVVIRPQPSVENGEIAAVYLNGEITLRRFYCKDGECFLKPENSAYSVLKISLGSEPKIIGKMIEKISKAQADQLIRRFMDDTWSNFLDVKA